MFFAVLGIVLGMACIFFVSMWIAIAIALEDSTVPIRNNFSFKNVLVIFPHPDDESMTCGGLVQILREHGAHATLLILTKGECGTPDASLQAGLGKTRTAEAKQSAHVLSYTQCIVEDMGDGKLSTKKTAVKKKVASVMQKVKPDLVVSYDLSGVYGHADHIALAEIVTELIKTNFKKTTLWYVTLSKFTFTAIKLPIHMAKSDKFLSLRSIPMFRVFIGARVIGKLRSIYSHKSQLNSFKEVIPLHLPLWFVHSTRLYEYYTQAWPKPAKS